MLAVFYENMVQSYQNIHMHARKTQAAKKQPLPCPGCQGDLSMNLHTREAYHEKKTHFDAAFPYNTYLCCIPQDFLSVPLHWHEEMEIIYIKKGRGYVSVDLSSFEVRERHIVFIIPGQIHGISQYGNVRLEYETILFDLGMLESKNLDICTASFFMPLQQSRITGQHIYTPQNPAYQKIAGWIDQADEICKTFPCGYQLAIKGCLFSLFYELLPDWNHSAAQVKIPPSFEKLKKIIRYVESHYQERITIQDAASYCDYSPSHFMKYFKRAMGMSFIEYLNGFRLEKACQLLLASDSTVLEISQEAGFDNLSYFNRCFKKKFAQTPSAYRSMQLHLRQVPG